MLFISPGHNFLPEHKIATKIQIDNSIDLGWKKEDLILATNFPYEYRGIKALELPDSLYTPFCPTVSIINVIVELFDRKIVGDDEIWWYHDHDAYQLNRITESELDLGQSDMALSYKGLKEKWDTGSIFFKKSAEDIFRRLKEVANKFQVNEEYALMALFTNNLLWITESEYDARSKFTPLQKNGMDLKERIKTLNFRYLFGADHDQIYGVAKKPVKVLHFHFSNDRLLDSAMYGKNSINKHLMPKRLINIFHKHGVKGIFPKKLKNLIIYFKPDKKFDKKQENLVKKQIADSLSLGWNNKDIILVTNFPYEFKDVRAKVVNKSLTSAVIYELLNQEIIGEGELWWFHDLDVLQTRPFTGHEIELDGTGAGFVDFGNFFFRKGSKKLFEWIRNRALRLRSDEATALMTLSETNYRNINTMYKKLKLVKMFKQL